MDDKPTLRERKKQKTRTRLLDAAHKMFVERGFEQTTLEDICEEAEVSLRTFFRYFGSKLDLALETNYRNAEQRRIGLADPHRTESVLAFLRRSYTESAEEFSRDRRAVERLRFMRDEPTLAAKALLLDLRTENEIAEALQRESGQGDLDVSARVIAGATVSGVRWALLRWLSSKGREDIRELIGSVFDRIEEIHGSRSASASTRSASRIRRAPAIAHSRRPGT